MKRNKGFALMASIFVVIIFSALAVVVVSLISGENLQALRDYNSVRAFQLADAGLRYTIATSLAADADFSDNTGFTKTLGAGYFTVTYTYRTTKTCSLLITGTVGGITRSIGAGLKRSGLSGAFDYGVFCGNLATETLYIQNSATIYGDFYYNGPVIMQNTSKLLNGTMFSDSLTLQHSAYCASWEPAPDINPPLFDPSYYDNLLTETTKSATSALDLSSGTLALNGQTLYYTSITIRNSAVVMGPGRLVATTGNFKINNSAKISDEVMVIVKGTSALNNSSVIGADFNLISKGSITVNNSQNVPREAIFFSYGDITFDNTAQFWGSILAPSGEVTSSNSTIFNGLIYGYVLNLQNSTVLNGSAAVGSIGYFKNTTQVTYDPSKFPAIIPQGLEGAGESAEGTSSMTNWGEIF